MLRDLGHEVSATAVAELYHDLLDVFVLDKVDAEKRSGLQSLGMRVLYTDTVMNTLDDKQQLARWVLETLKLIHDTGITGSGATSI